MAKATNKSRSLQAKTTKTFTTPKRKSLDINYKVSGDLGILYADQFVVQFYSDEFIVSFFQSEHPLVFSEEEFEKRNELEARCIARFALSPPQMSRFLTALQTNVKKWQEIHLPEAERTKTE